MIRSSLAAATALLLVSPVLSPPASAQTAQEQLDARYDRALAAGYKALFLCGAIFSARETGRQRTPESVMEWELSGIYPALDPLIAELPFQMRGRTVSVDWADDMPPRFARYRREDGCKLAPIGLAEDQSPGAIRARTGSLASGPHDPWLMIKARRGYQPSLVEAAFGADYGEGTRTTAALVVRDGDIMSEHYAPGFDERTPQRTWSVAKSIAATMVGAAVQGGLIAVSDSAGLGTSENDPRRAITVDHLLRMASGRYTDTPGNRTDPLYLGGSSVAETALHWPLIHAPGSTFRYANNDTLAAVQALKTTGLNMDRHVRNVLSTAGMHDTKAETDWDGDHILSSQVWSTARDFAHLGLLHLNDGALPDGTRILPEGWLEYVSTPSGPQPEGRGFGYGAGWWLLNDSEGVPPDTIAAMGNRGQYVVVVPSRNVVIVRRGEDPVGARFDIAAFTRDILAALD